VGGLYRGKSSHSGQPKRRIIAAIMTDEEIDFVKKAFKRNFDSLRGVWLERVLLWNLILESRWMTEPNLKATIARAKARPDVLRQAEEFWAASDQELAEIGIEDWLANFDKKHPPIE
jgi:hypothetical protein